MSSAQGRVSRSLTKHVLLAAALGLAVGVVGTWKVTGGPNTAAPRIFTGTGYVYGDSRGMSITTTDGNSLFYPTQGWQGFDGVWRSRGFPTECAPPDHEVPVEVAVVDVRPTEYGPGYPEHVMWVRCMGEPVPIPEE